MQANHSKRVITVVIVSFLAYYLLYANFKAIKVALDQLTQQGLLSYVLTYILIGIPIFIGTYSIDKTSPIVKSLGLHASLLTALWTSTVFCLPMWIGSLFYFELNQAIDMQQLIAGTIIAGIMEELYFRGFLFGQLFKHTKLGFIPAIFFGALIFASGHLYQSQAMSELFGIFMLTFAGAIFFAWLYVEWNYNLWVPIFTHTLMNLCWHVFSIDNTALGDLKANVFRALTILSAILFTVLYKRSRKEKLLINKQSLFVKRNSPI